MLLLRRALKSDLTFRLHHSLAQEGLLPLALLCSFSILSEVLSVVRKVRVVEPESEMFMIGCQRLRGVTTSTS